MRRTTTLLATATIAVALAGCGGDGSDSASSKAEQTTPATQATTAAAEAVVPAEVEPGLVAHYKALTEAGYGVSASEVSNALGALSVSGGVEIVHYASLADAAEDDLEFGDLKSKHPDRVRYLHSGEYIYWVAEERALTDSEIKTFKDVVRIGEGQ